MCFQERVAKRGRKLVDYDSARHHLEALQSAKKKDEAKITKVGCEARSWSEENPRKYTCVSFTHQAEEEFNRAQNVFEEINNELREELPVLYQRYQPDPASTRILECGEMKVEHKIRSGADLVTHDLENDVFIFLNIRSNISTGLGLFID